MQLIFSGEPFQLCKQMCSNDIIEFEQNFYRSHQNQHIQPKTAAARIMGVISRLSDALHLIATIDLSEPRNPWTDQKTSWKRVPADIRCWIIGE
jgi:hypothetical protein